MIKLLALLKECASNLFYGEVLIKFERGKVVIFHKTEKFKPTE